MSKLAKALTAAAGNAGGESLYVEDVFSTYLYEGNGATQTITNGIDLDGEGGLVWSKKRSGSEDHVLFDTEAQKRLVTNTTASGGSGYIPTYFNFLADGYFMDWSAGGMPNDNGDDYASWTFRKAEKFFDVVTYTGTGSAQNISHNLGSVPACIIVKDLSTTSNWMVYHSYMGADGFAYLNLTNAAITSGNTSLWNNTEPTDSVFTVGTSSNVNTNGNTYVAYLFASDAGGFGDDGSESIIKCGSYTGNGSADGPTINCGFEPQWLLIKNTSDGGNWVLMDAMRGMPVGDEATVLLPNASGAESSYANLWGVDLQATGFKVNVSQIQINESGGTMIYIAIRRPMKTPESGTEVFDPLTYSGNETTRDLAAGFAVDMTITPARTGSSINRNVYDRLRGRFKLLNTNSTNAEGSNGSAYGIGFDEQDGTTAYLSTNNANAHTYVNYAFKRATGFFDVVAYTGDGASSQSINHNLGVTPEMMIVKRRESAADWICYHSGNTAAPETEMLKLNTTDATTDFDDAWRDTAPTSSVFTVGSWSYVNASGGSYIAYLFATLAGVSKVGSYTGTGSNVDVDCGFSAGARFVLIRRTDSTGDWYVWDSVRGIVAGNDPYLLLNSTAAEVTSTDYIDPLSSGFTVTSSAPAALNASGGNYIFLAIAQVT